MITLACLVLSILSIVAMWFIFEKAGEAGWKSLIPLYNVYIMFKIARNPKFIQYILSICLMSISLYALIFGLTGAAIVYSGTLVASGGGMIALTIIGTIGFLATMIDMFVIAYQLNADLFENFGYERAFAWLILINPAILVMYCIIGFKKDTEYQPVREEVTYKGVVWEAILCFVLLFVAVFAIVVAFVIMFAVADPEFAQVTQFAATNLNHLTMC